jgi:hypothetical protein
MFISRIQHNSFLSDGTIALKAADGTHTVGYLTQRTVSGYGDLEVWLTLE